VSDVPVRTVLVIARSDVGRLFGRWLADTAGRGSYQRRGKRMARRLPRSRWISGPHYHCPQRWRRPPTCRASRDANRTLLPAVSLPSGLSPPAPNAATEEPKSRRSVHSDLTATPPRNPLRQFADTSSKSGDPKRSPARLKCIGV